MQESEQSTVRSYLVVKDFDRALVAFTETGGKSNPRHKDSRGGKFEIYFWAALSRASGRSNPFLHPHGKLKLITTASPLVSYFEQNTTRFLIFITSAIRGNLMKSICLDRGIGARARKRQFILKLLSTCTSELSFRSRRYPSHQPLFSLRKQPIRSATHWTTRSLNQRPSLIPT